MSLGELPGEVRVLTDPVALAAVAADWIATQCHVAGDFRIAVSGGHTPRFLYEALASSTFRPDIDWPRWHLYFADERAVPPDHADSNYRLLADTLLTKVSVPPSQVHRMEAERADLDAAAADYSRVLEAECGATPRLDIVLLGLGTDGHTASLFPGTSALDVDDSWATRGRATYAPFDRLTLTLPTINAAAHAVFLVTGDSKADALRGVIDGTVPAARVRPVNGELHWFLDSTAARSLG